MFARSLTSHAITSFLKHAIKPFVFRPGVNIVDFRRQASAISGRLSKMPRDMRVCNGRLEGIPVKWLYSEKSSPDFVILYLHGGGFVLPALKPHFSFCAFLARKTAATVIMPDYRLAPEHPYPAGYEDCLASYRWLLDHGYAPERIIIAGDSAGGNLALATVVGARRAGLPLPAGIVKLSPALRVVENDGSHKTNEEKEAMLSRQTLEYLLACYVPPGVDVLEDTLSPLEADFSGLPPMRFYVGSTEVLLDDSLLGAEKAREEGVDVEIMIGEGMPHVWPLIDLLPESRPARQDVVSFINSRWRGLRPGLLL